MTQRAEAWRIIQGLEPATLLYGEYGYGACTCPIVHVRHGLGLGLPPLFSMDGPDLSRAGLEAWEVALALEIAPEHVNAFMDRYDFRCNRRAASYSGGVTGDFMKEIAKIEWQRHIPIEDEVLA